MKNTSLQFWQTQDINLEIIIWSLFYQKNLIRPRINLKIVPKFQLFCYRIKCTIVKAPKQLHKITDLCLKTI